MRKLFELSRSSNENEAALAAAKARELLSAYNLTVADLPADRMQAHLSIVESSIHMGRVLRNWVKSLMLHVGRGFECEVIIRRQSGKAPVPSYIGTAADSQVAAYTCIFLYQELNRLVDQALPRLKRENRRWHASSLRHSYLEGAVNRIGERFREEILGLRHMEESACKDLIPAKNRMIKTYMQENFNCVYKEYGKSRTLSRAAFKQGYEDAASVDLRPGIEQSKQCSQVGV
ncbi:MAG TPA: DUF2786 domain-containing protein [Desulfomonilaceae bacterium]|nr:DUF2786 domain-containing protein [Desulfomonilaceae bacterium]